MLGSGASRLAHVGLGKIVRQDSQQMLDVLSDELRLLCDEYLLDAAECAALAEHTVTTVNAKWLRAMYRAGRRGAGDAGRRDYARQSFESMCADLVRARPSLRLLTPEDVQSTVTV